MYYKNIDILVPIDFSDASLRALREAVGLVRACGGKITLLHIGVVPHIYATDLGPTATVGTQLLALSRQLAQEQEHHLQKVAKEEIPEDVEFATVLREGFPPSEILAQLEEGGHSLLCMGTHGRTGLKRVLLGSVTERVLREAKVPVIVAH